MRRRRAGRWRGSGRRLRFGLEGLIGIGLVSCDLDWMSLLCVCIIRGMDE